MTKQQEAIIIYNNYFDLKSSKDLNEYMLEKEDAKRCAVVGMQHEIETVRKLHLEGNVDALIILNKVSELIELIEEIILL